MRFTFIILLIFVLFIILWKYGRSIYIPIFQKLKGRESVQSVINKIQGDASKRLKPYFLKSGFEDVPTAIQLIAFKEEQVLELYGTDNKGWRLIKQYPFTAFSGQLGPKLREGDKQIPEGIYKIDYLNPNSLYYLSLKVNYPNEDDFLRSKLDDKSKIGGDIFIHGKSLSIGCIAVGDEAIEEIFWLASKFIENGIKVIISPRDFRVNPNYPNIEGLECFGELYDKIFVALNALKI